MSLADELEAMARRVREMEARESDGAVKAIKTAVLEALETRDADRMVDIDELAVIIGRSVAGARTFITRPQGAALRECAEKIGGSLRWKRSVVLDVVERMGGKRKRA